MTERDPYAPEALFRCDQGHGTFRRDQCRSRRGQLECPRCLVRAVVGTLRYVEPTPSPQTHVIMDRKLLEQAHAVMRACGWHLAPGAEIQGDGILEAACAEIEEKFRAALATEGKTDA